jgi:aryl-alcohol dehydrogenase-like predicted oxidoreductase
MEMGNELNPELTKKLVIGTAQFGLDYGISNFSGKVNQKEVNAILKFASEMGIKFLDTATAYGDSEEAIGQSVISSNEFKIISKCHKESHTRQQVFDSLDHSLKKLGSKQLYGYLAHDFQSIQSEEFYESLQAAKTFNKAIKIGVSAYYPWQVEWIFENVEIDIIQFPYNLFDRRFKYLLPELRKRKIEVHVRSVFLQGLFFLPIKQLGNHFNPIKPILKKLDNLTDKYELGIPDLLLNFCLAENLIDKTLIGVTSVNELKQNVQSLNVFQLMQNEKIFEQLDDFEIHDESILLPFNWPMT